MRCEIEADSGRWPYTQRCAFTAVTTAVLAGESRQLCAEHVRRLVSDGIEAVPIPEVDVAVRAGDNLWVRMPDVPSDADDALATVLFALGDGRIAVAVDDAVYHLRGFVYTAT